MQVFVLGMHRSGTSALARVLNLMGLYFGGENVGTGRSAENVKGFWERRDVRDLNDAILTAAGCDWDVVSGLDLDALPSDTRAGYVAAAGDIVLNLDAHRPWFIKEPRLSVLFPVWREALETPFAIHIHRNPLEVARSLQGRNGIPIQTGLALWEYYNLRALEATDGLPRHFIAYEDLMARPAATVQSLHGFLSDRGYDLRVPPADELAGFLDPALHRQQASAEEFSACAAPSQCALYDYLKAAPAGSAPPVPSAACVANLRAHEATVDLGLRAQRADDGRERRTERHLELQLAIRGVDLRHAVAARDEALTRNDALARKLDRFQDERRDLAVKLALSGERARTAEKGRAEADERTRALRHQLSETRESSARQLSEAREASAQQLRQMRIDNERKLREARETGERQLSELRTDSERQLSELRTDSERQLSEARDASERDRGVLEGKLQVLRRDVKELGAQRQAWRKREAASNLVTSASRAESRVLLRRWDAEIERNRVTAAELDEFIRHLRDGLSVWIASRRFRLGNALVSLPRRLTLRAAPAPVLHRLQAATYAHETNKAVDDRAARTQSPRLDSAERAARATGDADDLAVIAESARDAVLQRQLLDRLAALGKWTVGIAERRRFAEELIALAETVHASRRWRLGHFLLSLPGRALGRGRPATAADALTTLIAEFRREADRPLPVEPPDEPLDEPPEVPKEPQETAPQAETPKPIPTQSESAPLFPAPVTDDVDVVVCVHNALAHVERCLESVLTRTTVPYRLIVVNDGSDGPTSQRLRSIAASEDVVELIETADGPLGYTCAANHGLRASTASNVVLLNSDTIVPRLWLEGLLDCMASDPDLGIVGPLSNAASWQSVPERTGADGRWAVNPLPPGYNVDEYAELIRFKSKRAFPRVDFVNGFCFMVKRSVIERIGYLDEESFPRGYGEENDYCMRAQDAGFEMAVADHCLVYHAKSKSFGDAARDRLAQAGGEALERKHGKMRLDRSSKALKDSRVLADIRATVRSSLPASCNEPALGTTPNASVTGNHVLYVLPVRGGSGGANSVVQEAVGMRALGVDAKVATHVKYRDHFERFYPEFFATGEHFVFYDSDAELMRCAAPFQVIVATLWSSPALLAPVANRWPNKLFVYYVQDYEPWFFAEDDPSRQIALDSYTLIPGMALMAKTDWICRTVQARHDRPVYRVAPSLDHSVFHPRGRASDTTESPVPVRIAAMFRPTTPRRGPLRTIRVLKRVLDDLKVTLNGAGAKVLLFGCETQHVHTYIARNAPELKLTKDFEGRGVLRRHRVAKLLREADIFVDLSDYQAFGRSGLEAMACGCAVVLPKEGGVYEYAVDGDNCLIVDTSNDDEMVRAIRALATDTNLRHRMGARGIETAAGFDIARASVSELSVFRAAMAARDGHTASRGGHGRGLMPDGDAFVTSETTARASLPESRLASAAS